MTECVVKAGGKKYKGVIKKYGVNGRCLVEIEELNQTQWLDKEYVEIKND